MLLVTSTIYSVLTFNSFPSFHRSLTFIGLAQSLASCPKRVKYNFRIPLPVSFPRWLIEASHTHTSVYIQTQPPSLRDYSRLYLLRSGGHRAPGFTTFIMFTLNSSRLFMDVHFDGVCDVLTLHSHICLQDGASQRHGLWKSTVCKSYSIYKKREFILRLGLSQYHIYTAPISRPNRFEVAILKNTNK